MDINKRKFDAGIHSNKKDEKKVIKKKLVRESNQPPKNLTYFDQNSISKALNSV